MLVLPSLEDRERMRAESLAAYKATAEYRDLVAQIAPAPLDARAGEEDIAQQVQQLIGRVKTMVHAYGRTLAGPQTLAGLASNLDALALAGQARPVNEKISLQGAIARMLEPSWWRRNLRRELLQANEVQEHAGGTVRRRLQCYVSDHGVKRKAARAKANRRTLEMLEVVSSTGEALNLQEVADASVSNPKLRRAELMVRCRGFEETAQYMGHDGIFLTLTCPSRFHRFDGAGRPNPKWDGSTPKDGQDYLCGVWQKIRAAWNRKGYMPYGFRVAEPHHDGCPHWHILLFVVKESAGWFDPAAFVAKGDKGAGVIGIAGRYALQESAGERGAIKHRFTCKHIDPSQGSATGYIAKYIAKNIDGLGENGEGVGLDFASGTPAQEGAKRVRTWASIHGIRQFQQVGGPSVTVWRELRRMGDKPVQNDLFELPRGAADGGLWSLFWILQGGPEVARKDLTLKPCYLSTGAGRYGDDVPRVWGVTGKDGGQEYGLQTRLKTWTVQRAGLNAINLYETARLDVRAAVANAEAFVQAAGFASVPEFWASSAACAPWTGVNNCTPAAGQDGQDDEAELLKLDLMRGQGMNFEGWDGKPNLKIKNARNSQGPDGPICRTAATNPR